MGEAPDWWFLIRAARYLGVAPWDLARQPVFWMDAALVTETVEAEYQKQQQDLNNMRNERGWG